MSQYQTRLRNEYEAMLRFPVNNLIRIAVTPGQKPPYVTSYTVTYCNKTLVKAPSGAVVPQMNTVVRIDLSEDFPYAAPTARVVGGSIPFHPNWYTSGRVCSGNIWMPGGWLWDYVLKIGRVLAFDPGVTNPGSAANHEAVSYWHRNRRSFPCGRTDFPHPRGH